MHINFEEIKETTLKNFKGGENEILAKIYSDDSVKIIKSILKPGSSIGYHKHIDNFEVVYVLKGEANILDDGKEYVVKENEAHYCPKGHSHGVKNKTNSDLVVFCVVPNGGK
ncbi:MAG: cupin domain-containing protein [Bacilli bacterium]